VFPTPPSRRKAPAVKSARSRGRELMPLEMRVELLNSKNKNPEVRKYRPTWLVAVGAPVVGEPAGAVGGLLSGSTLEALGPKLARGEAR
jgi:hypothetical protein